MLRQGHAIKAQEGFDPVLCPHTITHQLAASAHHLSLATLCGRRHPDSLEHSFSRRDGQLARVEAVGLDAIARLLWNQRGWSDETLGAIFRDQVMEPETEVAGFINDLDGLPSIAIKQRAQ